jgi:type IV fimbrial biogenesis protein FimT
VRHAKGYTLLELMLALAVAAVLLGLAGPGMNGLLAHNHRVAAVNNLVGSLQYARSEAHKLSAEVVLCPSRDQLLCETGDEAWEHGWLVFADYSPSRPRQVDAEDVILLVRRQQARVTVRANRPAFVLRPFYRRSSNGTFRVCPTRAATPPVALIVSYTGRPRLSARLADGRPIDCPDAS